MVLKEIVPNDWDVKILATDLDSQVLATAQLGIYEDEKITGVSVERKHRWFKKGKGVQTGWVQVIPNIQTLISFKLLNLMNNWPMRGPFDIIFCRNVAIYFNKASQKILFERFANIIDDQGYLLIGHSENLFQLSSRFRLLRQTVYVKC